MSWTTLKRYWFIYSTIFFALSLHLLPLPSNLIWYRPPWLALIVTYWVLEEPEYCNIGTAWVCGLLLDALDGTTLGMHSIALSIISYLTLQIRLMVRMYPWWQQTLVVLLIIFLYQVILIWIKSLLGLTTSNWLFWFPTITTIILWPVLCSILWSLRQKFRILTLRHR